MKSAMLDDRNALADQLSAESLVLPLPHFSVSGGELRFLISRRPLRRLSEDEAAVWRSIGEGALMSELRRRHGAAADKAVATFLKVGACESVSGHWPTGRRRILVIEPHSDDAALSVGATMWMRRHEVEFTILTVASRSNFTSYWQLGRDYFKVEPITALRNAEGALVARCLGGRHDQLGINEATLRYRDGDWSHAWFKEHEQSIYMSNIHRVGDAHVDAVASRLGRYVLEHRFDEVWSPMGVGPHSDHEVTRIACLRLFISRPELLSDAKLCLYQDVPYDSEYSGHSQRIVEAFRQAGGELVPEPVDVSVEFHNKLRLLRCYASQFKLEVMLPAIERSAGTPYKEHIWSVACLPASMDESSMYVGSSEVSRVALDMGADMGSFVRAPVIRLIMLLPSGNWESDMKGLLAQFPESSFEVHISVAGRAETSSFQSERITVRGVKRGGRAWIRELLRLAVRWPRPTIAIVGPKRAERARRLARWWPLNSTVIAGTLDQFVMGIRKASSEAGRS